MKYFNDSSAGNDAPYMNIPVVRLDSEAVDIPVGMLDNFAAPKKKHIVRITVSNGSFCSWS